VGGAGRPRAAASATSPWRASREVRHPDHELVLDVPPAKIRGLAVADELCPRERERLLSAWTGGKRHVVAVLERLRGTLRRRERHRRVACDFVASDLDVLEVRAGITGWFETPVLQTLRHVRRRETIAFGEHLPAL